MRTWSMSVASALIALSLASTGIAATTQRTFVAASGSDANPCSITSPCRSFGRRRTDQRGWRRSRARYGGLRPGDHEIDCDHRAAGRLRRHLGAAGGYGVLIQAGAIDIVALRGLIERARRRPGRHPHRGRRSRAHRALRRRLADQRRHHHDCGHANGTARRRHASAPQRERGARRIRLGVRGRPVDGGDHALVDRRHRERRCVSGRRHALVDR